MVMPIRYWRPTGFANSPVRRRSLARHGTAMKRIYVVGTADTKGEELLFLRGLIDAAGLPVCLTDVGTREAKVAVDIAAREVAAQHPRGADAVFADVDRRAAITAMAQL